MRMYLALAWTMISLSGSALAEDGEVVVAMRYLQPEGVSHAHLYLYREDGRLLRQLTHDDSGQEFNPRFAPNGETIVFTRKVKGVEQWWSIQPRGKGLRRLKAAPEWYQPVNHSPYYVDREATEEVTAAPTYQTPDGKLSLVLVRKTDLEDTESPGGAYELREVGTAKVQQFRHLPGYEDGLSMLRIMPLMNTEPPEVFLWKDGLKAAFFSRRLDSTNGTTVYALDLAGKRLVQLGPNYAAPFAMPGQAAFLTFDEVRYLPIPGSEKTANCSFLERWDAQWKPLRYAKPGLAGILYGFSMYRPSYEPRVISAGIEVVPE